MRLHWFGLKVIHIHLFVHSGYFYSTSSSPLLLSTDTVSEFYAEAPQAKFLQVKNLPKVPTWRLEWTSNLWPFGRKASNLQMSPYAPQSYQHTWYLSNIYQIYEQKAKTIGLHCFWTSRGLVVSLITICISTELDLPWQSYTLIGLLPMT